ncbi:MAG: hypothetical protein IPJ88_11880 [Myxococcales bacterium]|nr:MAG: hypothetical protein IPJ88_11880 [Myxococcales bacterium]
MTRHTLQCRATKKAVELDTIYRDRRFVRVVGKLIDLGLLDTTMLHIGTYRGKIKLDDALWAGQYEMRILELLPALVMKKPGIFYGTLTLAKDLEAVCKAIRAGKTAPSFRGVAAEDYMQWITRVGHRGKMPSVLKSFRFSQSDLEKLHALKSAIGAKSDTDTLRYSLGLALSQLR